MGKESSKELTQPFIEAAKKTKSFTAARRGDWVVKFSIYDDQTILIFVESLINTKTYVRFFSNEDEAVQFINFVVNLD